MSSQTGTLYIGVTNNLDKRVFEHKNKVIPGFTAKYNINRLVFFQEFNEIEQAIAVEKKIKGWGRKKKIDLIRNFNPEIKDLSGNLRRLRRKVLRTSEQVLRDPSLRSG